jgi:Domain of unknown function (DUF4421)
MNRRLFYTGIFIPIYLFCNSHLFAQPATVDTNYIHSFDKQNILEINPGVYSSRFNFTNPGERKNDYRLVANSSGYVGIYLGYKWLSLKYSWAMPGTQLDKNVKLQYTSLGFRFGERHMRFHPFYDSYNGLLIPVQKHKDSFDVFRGIQFSDAGFDFFYFTNTKRFSFSAAYTFSEQQAKSTGSFLIMATPLWQKVNWKSPSRDLISDSATYTLLSSDPHWLSLIARIGYTYNFTFQKGKWSIGPAVLIGGGGLKEMNTPDKNLQAVTDIQAWLKAGYNGPNYYIYFNAWWDNLKTNLFIKNLHQVNTDFSIKAGYRFHSWKKKVLGVL